MIANKNDVTWQIGGVCHTWTAGENYELQVGESTVTFSSNAGAFTVPLKVIIAASQVFENVFGANLSEMIPGAISVQNTDQQKSDHRKRAFFRDWRMR